jgi:transposase
MRFIARLSENEKQLLYQTLLDTTLIERERKRFTAILLSSEHSMRISDIATTCSVSQNSVKNWFNAYEQGGLEALKDKNMAHKVSSLATCSEETIMTCVAENPQNLRLVVTQLAHVHQIETNPTILKTYLKKKSGLGEESAKV